MVNRLTPVGSIRQVLHKVDGPEVAHGNLVWRRVLDDLGAKVGRLDGAQVLLVGLAIARVLVKHIWSSGLNLRLDDGVPQCLGLDLE